MDANYFQSQLWAAYRNHKETGDWFAYIGDCTQAGFRLYTTHLAERNKAYKHLPIIVSASAYPIKVAVDLCAHELYCPPQRGHCSMPQFTEWRDPIRHPQSRQRAGRM